MPALNTLRTVTIRQVSEGADKVRSDLDGLVSAQQRVAQASEQTATVTETASRRQLSAAAAYDKVRASVDLNYRAQQQLERQTRTLDRAFQQGVVDVSQYDRTLGQLQARYSSVAGSAAAAAKSQRDAWRDLGEQGRSTFQSLEASRKLGSLGMAPPAAANQNGRLRSDQVQNLAYQGSDILSSLGSGSSLTQVAFQQGPQIAQVFGGEGGASVRGAFDQAKDAVSGFLGRIGPVGAAIGVVTAVVGTGVAALMSYASSQREIEKSLGGVGRASGATVGQINALAPAAAAAAGVSVASARQMAGTFASTGLIGTEMYSGLIKQSRDYAMMTGTDAAEASTSLAEAFADPARGALDLNKKLGFLNAEMLESIQTMQASGNRLGAQKLLMEGVASATANAESKLGFFARGWAEFSKNSSNEFNAIGGFISRGFGMDDAEARLKTLQGQLGARQSRMGTAGGLFDSIIGFDIDTIKADIAKVQAEIDKAAAANKKSGLGLRGLEIDGLVKGLNPASEQLKRLEEGAANIKKGLAEGVLDPAGNSRRTMDGLLIQAKQLASDMAAGGAQFADAIARAKFDQRTVGFSPTAKSAADINEDARVKDLNALRDAGNNAASEAYLKAAQSIEQVRVTELQTLQSRTVLDAGANGSGRYSKSLADAPAQYRDAYYQSSLASGVNADLLVSQGFRESGFNPNAVSSAKAKGIAQFMDPTARGIGLTNPFDPIQSIMKQGELMAQLLKQFNGNETLALVGYNAGPKTAERYRDSGFDPSVLRKETRDYIPAITTARPGAEQMVKSYDSLDRAQRDAGKSLEDLQKFYGKNGQALELAQAQQAKYTELLNQGVPAQQAASIAYGDLIKKTVEFGQSAKMVQFSADNQFNREQLGRSASDQNAYAQARSRIGDTTSPDAQRMIADVKETNELVDAKNQASSALSGFALDLAHGATAAQAAASALGRLADSILNKVIDSVVSSAFGSVAKGGIGSLFGFATGGIMTSNGPLPLHSYATGGIANSPQLALFGEGRGPEAFVPLPDGKRIPVAMSQPANMNGGGSVSVNHAPTYNVTPATGVTPEQLAAVVDRNNRDFANRLPSLIKEADRRRA
ncbi:hypothetical protein FPV16_23880 [Methylobacterium sp. W2]|uniref:phage tail length tape measure family protein n=1 Tax=Methylobacterium sp. W2 TaxID=2598107 RepID=UPI001D0C0C62|nr:phage tail length tape measure family protein [Methylobacterium sp. W2]MCC0809199.1 hypothetical protein [Methylobacterium sp. W2]